MTDYLCTGFPPIQSVCKLTLTFPDTFIIQNYLVTNFGGTAHLRRLHFSLLLAEKWGVSSMYLNSLHPKVSKGPVSWRRCFMEAVQWNTGRPAAVCQEQDSSTAFFWGQCFSPWTCHPQPCAKPHDITEVPSHWRLQVLDRCWISSLLCLWYHSLFSYKRVVRSHVQAPRPESTEVRNCFSQGK